MQTSIHLLTTIGLFLSLTQGVVAQTQQRTNATASRDMMRAPGFRGVADTGRNRMGSYQTGTRQGFTTRHDQMKSILAATTAQRSAAYRNPRRTNPLSPIDQIFNSRNLLSAQSPLAKHTLTRDPYATVSADDMPRSLDPLREEGAAEVTDESTSVSERPTTSQFLDGLTSDLSTKGDEYFEIGVAYFRNGDYLRAKDYFEMDREIHRHGVRAYTADVLTAGEKRDINRAYTSLMLAIRRAEKLEELALRKEDFYADPIKFDRTLSLMNVMVNQGSDQPATHALLAYYSWLNGDEATARASADRAMTLAKGSEKFDAQTGQILSKFAQLMSGTNEKSPTSPPATTGR